MQILNLRPPEITAAWLRGDIDAAYVWDPALGKVKESGSVLVNSTEVAKWGAPTFDAWIVRKDFARAHPDFVTAFVRITGKAYADYRKSGKSWASDSAQADKIARLTGANKGDIPGLLQGSFFPTLDEQASARLLAGGTIKAIADTSLFLKEQKKTEQVLTDYKPYRQSAVRQAGFWSINPSTLPPAHDPSEIRRHHFSRKRKN